ncbi:N-acetyltransferase family protein [Alteriqipengyuania sp.]|uniref:GNAT family N-acetyltransferase n=1 Tax=Alteriqipengyuania sp. TaxID=2800692 RepID=UPI0035158C7C
MILRPATPEDAPALATLGRESFSAAFAHLYRPEDLSAFLEESYAEEAVAQEIADDRYIHRLADDGTRLLAFVKLSRPSGYAEHSDAANPIALGQLYTQPDATGRGIGAALMEWAMAEAQARGHDAIQLSVWSENHRAQAFYQRYGFAKIADIDFWVGTHRDDEFLYERRF